MKQLNLFKEKQRNAFGGTLLLGKRRTARPLDTKRAQHFVFKTSNHNLLLRNRKKVEEVSKRMSRRFGVKIYSLAVQTDHIHVNVRLTNRLTYRRWIRALSSRLVAAISGLKFTLRPYSRIVNWGRQFKSVCKYIHFDSIEAEFILQCHVALEKVAADLSRAWLSHP